MWVTTLKISFQFGKQRFFKRTKFLVEFMTTGEVDERTGECEEMVFHLSKDCVDEL